MKKIISFSLWGNDPKYGVGAIINAQLAEKYFSDWTCYFYYNYTVPKIYIDCLNNFSNSKTILVEDDVFGAFWRFRSMVPDSIVLSRDTDSRLSLREKNIIDDWLLSKNKLCTIRDHANHYEFPILAGMWAVKDGLDEEDFSKISNYNTPVYLMDQYYLRDVIWPKYKSSFSEYGIKENIWMRNSYETIGKDFIGQTYDENNQPVYDQKL